MCIFTDLGLLAQAVNGSRVGLALWAVQGPAARRQNALAEREHLLLRELDPGRKGTWRRSSKTEIMTTGSDPGTVQAFSGAGVSREAGHVIPSVRGSPERPAVAAERECWWLLGGRPGGFYGRRCISPEAACHHVVMELGLFLQFSKTRHRGD